MIAENTPQAVAPAEAPPSLPVAPDLPCDAVVPPPAADSRPRLFAHLLRLADGHLARNEPWQAKEIYLKIVDDGGDSPEVDLAAERLLQIAGRHERDGQTHLARSIYERLIGHD
jgi:hypothetical protein